ncbi:protein saal1 [Nephila pilipes]|uniref:Protein saal1 n=1 Tax=Nephila pilipes TaxID=299642 RepID=A0A8X6NLS7_NEPPI|nr:protein saal1 [Nephila pilipes]
MSSEPDRNPSPPPELLTNKDLLPDRIGESVYSKRWLYKTLMNIIAWCENPKNALENKVTFTSNSSSLEESTKKTDNDSETELDENTLEMVELDSKIEDQACTLWDMSANKEVAEFLNASSVPNIFFDIIVETKSPRLLEIVIGILGNMSSFDSICKSLSENKNLLNYIIILTGTSDTPTLLQVFRVILCGVSNKKSQNLWFDAFEENPYFMENIKFIFENSLKNTVIKGAFQLLHGILNENVKYCEMWGQPSHLKAIIDAGKQSLKLQECLDNFFCVLNILCQHPPNIEELAKNWLNLQFLFEASFLSLGEEETLPHRTRLAAVFSCFDTYDTLLTSDYIKREQVVFEIDSLKAMCTVAQSISALISDIRKHNLEVLDFDNPQENLPRNFLRRIEERDGTQYVTMMTEKEFDSWTILLETIIATARILSSYVEKGDKLEILEDIMNSEVAKENVGILII